MPDGDIPGLRVTTVEVPASGELKFRFLKNGDPEQVIGPATPECTRKSEEIVGPQAGLKNSWVVHGTPGQEIIVEFFMREGRRGLIWLKR